MSVLGTCVACEVPGVRVASCTNDCPCLVCETCADRFLQEGACGVCGMACTEDETWDASDPN